MEHEVRVSIDGITYLFLISTKGINLESIVPITEDIYVKYTNEWIKAIKLRDYLKMKKISFPRFYIDKYVQGIRIKNFKLEV